ncbi:PhzF family phenazine biosynthesis protein [Umezawaea sp. Da 62-37]|uniref:PhzF family phenazine biosynthesis protein n=1 Tax=Umezawaea sp. Da 62-37 TaxID=3075927 RepID=UPI0028F6D36A|nr:PhzF family phenazine biosynthesis protein [Umezawaea sp. Da 62-37]WNV92136.1 PhzF family phenazine biosynthesis protein [Umezawaea sp. Da 62-37]
MNPPVHLVHVFPAGPGGGNPAPIVIDADGVDDDGMRAVARDRGHESGFVLTAPPESGCDYALRFWVPNHEMTMCGHATVGAAWLLDHLGRLDGDEVAFRTRSGRVDARLSGPADDRTVEISQPAGVVEPVDGRAVSEVLAVLGVTEDQLGPQPVLNASTSRVKTLVPVADVSVLDGLRPDFSRMAEVCDLVGSTGLYPYAPSDPERRTFDARQFPRSSGYPEDAATGVAAAALSFGLLESGLVERYDRPIRVRQGRAMGRPSEIVLRFARDGGVWLGGRVVMA